MNFIINCKKIFRNLDYKNILFLLLILSIFPLLIAFISEYLFGLSPCKLCEYQRIPFFLVIIAIVTNLAFNFLRKKVIITICLFLFVLNAALAGYHFGVQNDIFSLVTGCTDNKINLDNVEELKKSIIKNRITRCDKINFSILGISLATWNMLYCISVVLFLLYCIRSLKRH